MLVSPDPVDKEVREGLQDSLRGCHHELLRNPRGGAKGADIKEKSQSLQVTNRLK